MFGVGRFGPFTTQDQGIRHQRPNPLYNKSWLKRQSFLERVRICGLWPQGREDTRWLCFRWGEAQDAIRRRANTLFTSINPQFRAFSRTIGGFYEMQTIG